MPFLHLHPRLPQDLRMSIKRFLLAALENLNTSGKDPSLVDKMTRESVYLSGAAAALKAVGAAEPQQMTEQAKELFDRRIALETDRQALVERIGKAEAGDSPAA